MLVESITVGCVADLDSLYSQFKPLTPRSRILSHATQTAADLEISSFM